MQTKELDPPVAGQRTAVEAPSRRFYRPELDVLRFVAFVMVYLGHTFYPSPGMPAWLVAVLNANAIAVPIFFALSAFLFTELLTVEKRTTGQVHLGAFYVRRCLRIWPLYLLALLVGFVDLRFRAPGAFPVTALLAYLFLVGDWYTTIHDYLPSGLIALWSIPVEEQFYLVWPLLMRRLGRRGLAIVSAIAWLLSQAVVVFLCHRRVDVDPGMWANSFVHLQYFALGVAVSLFMGGRELRIRGSVRFAMIGVAFLWLVVVERFFNPNSHDGVALLREIFPELLLAGLAVVLLLVGFHGWSACKDRKILQYLGKISYGLYVFHMPCLLLLGKVSMRLTGNRSSIWVVVLAFPTTIGVAALSYRFFEKPFLMMKERFAFVKTRAV